MSCFYNSVRATVRTFFKWVYGHRTYGLEHVYKGSAVIAANHTSFYDPPIVSTSWPIEVQFLARQSLFKNPLFGWLIRNLNTHPVRGDAADSATFKTICALLQEGKQVLLFPEGARSDNGELDTFKEGVALIAYRTKAVIIPVYVHGAFEVFSKYRKFPKLKGRTACVFGSPILFDQFQHLDKKEAYKAMTLRTREAILALKKWYEAGAVGIPP